MTQDYISTVLGLKSSSYHAMIPFLKRIGFLDSANIPTQRYKDFRSDQRSGFVMAKALKESFGDIYQAHEYAHKLSKDELIDIVTTKTGSSKDDKAVAAVVGSFQELVKHATFDIEDIPEEIGSDDESEEQPSIKPTPGIASDKKHKLGLSYTINLNLPPTTDIKVFDAIFQSLKKNILE